MGSSNSISEYHSKWKNQKWCDCGTSHFRAIKIDWRSHKMMNGAAEAGLHVVRGAVAVATLGISTVFNGGIAAPLHHAVLVIFVCDKCGGGEYWATYELATKGKEFNANEPPRVQLANPPITHVLSAHGCDYLLPCCINIFQSGNKKALESVRMQFSDLGLDHISDAFVKGFNMEMICAKCAKEVKHIDELCYCTEATNKCHHCNW
ncbi:hypothetical protein niasHT_027770 [Heterodera trifolii]|uniref:Uncharacterized protein n=1 Tax=Heterodera trifolii TaxID=157864 RepID=A0ABD2KIC6_9BILA